jgi:hypothetical protein
MKKILIVIAVIIIIKISLVIIFAESIAIAVAKHQIGRVLPGSEVSIGKCDVRFGRSIVLADITIKKNTGFKISVKEAGAIYDIGPLIKGMVSSAYVNGADINIDMPGIKLSDVGDKLGVKMGGRSFRIDALNVSDLKLNCNTKDLDAVVSLSGSFDAKELFPKNIGLIVDKLVWDGVKIEGLKLDVASGDPSGGLSIGSIKYNKMAVSGVTGRPSLANKRFSVEAIYGKIFNGSAKGALGLVAGSRISYAINLEFTGLDSGEMIKELDLADKAEARGLVKGSLSMEGEGGGIRLLKGAFVAEGEGGSFVIKDEALLKSIAERTKQPVEIIRESFQDYSYNKGSTWLFLEEKDLRLGASLEGEKGRRDVDVIIHEFK